MSDNDRKPLTGSDNERLRRDRSGRRSARRSSYTELSRPTSDMFSWHERGRPAQSPPAGRDFGTQSPRAPQMPPRQYIPEQWTRPIPPPLSDGMRRDPRYGAMPVQGRPAPGTDAVSPRATVPPPKKAAAQATRRKKRSRGRVIARRVAISMFGFLLVLLIGVWALWRYIFSGAHVGLTDLDISDVTIPKETVVLTDYRGETTHLDVAVETGETRGEEIVIPQYEGNYAHIMVIGVDSRDMNRINTNSDTMMLITLDRNSGTMRMTSFQRDMLVYMPGTNNLRKMNSAMYRGARYLLDTLKENFLLDIKDYVVINFNGAEEMVNKLGGVEIDVPNNPRLLADINRIIDEANYSDPAFKHDADSWSPYIEKPGLQLLNGRQAISFARSRKADSDYNRMRRQRQVIDTVFRRFRTA
ncbi:MAG: hypothetical protein GX907_02840, partial [Clostridiaceae bacterium]|nr:hypothetical protein [Clostridiaceae bacterium]